MEVRLAVDCRNVLGEGCLWEAEQGRLWWVDIEERRIHRFTPATGATESWATPHKPGAIALRATLGTTVVAAMGDGFAYLDLADDGTAAHRWIARPEEGRSGVRMNDGRAGPKGHFWAGSLSAQPDGHLWRLDPDGRVTQMLSGVAIANSLAFSPDERTLYFADSARATIWAFDLAADGQTISGRRVFARTPEGVGPDGATVDAAGGLWSAHWGASQVVRYLPTGEVDAVVPMPVSQPSCVCFGGEDLSTLYVTSARTGLSEAQLAREPLAGAVFAADLGGRVRGLPERRFAG